MVANLPVRLIHVHQGVMSARLCIRWDCTVWELTLQVGKHAVNLTVHV